jgi:hypothetical protein
MGFNSAFKGLTDARSSLASLEANEVPLIFYLSAVFAERRLIVPCPEILNCVRDVW